MNDVADFVVDYISSDVSFAVLVSFAHDAYQLQILGMVAINWLLIADIYDIFHEDCQKLCRIHSNAVDYPKSGTPVALNTVPKPPRHDHKPDWNAPETVNLDQAYDFYESKKAIGRLFRAIDLPDVRPHNPAKRRQRQHVQDDATEPDLDEVFAALCIGDRHDDALESAVKSRVAEFVDVDPHSEYVELAIDSLRRYAINLQGICACNTIHHKTAMLSEEEAVVGTIVAKCSQRRRRKDAMSQLREQTSYLVKFVQEELAGGEDTSLDEWLASAWAAWKVSRHLKDRFGAHSYGWIALGEVFGAIKAIEQEEASVTRR